MKKIHLTTGCLPDPEDKRDIPLSAVQKKIKIPDVYFTDIGLLDIDYQGRQPCCVGCAASKTAEWREYKDIGKVIDFSFRGLYALCKKEDGWEGDGTYLRTAMKVQQKYGVILEKDFPSNVNLNKEEFKDWRLITEDMLKRAYPHRIKTYARVDLDWEEIKQAIYQNGIVLGGVKLSREGWHNPPCGYVRPPKVGEKVMGHAIALFSYFKVYKDDLELVKQRKITMKQAFKKWENNKKRVEEIEIIGHIGSWSKNWGDHGIGYFSKEYLPYMFNPWTAVDIPTEIAKKMFKLLRVKGEKDVWAIKEGKRYLIINKYTFEKGRDLGLWLDWDSIKEVSKEELLKYQEEDIFLILPSD